MALIQVPGGPEGIPRRPTITQAEQKFLIFHEANPHVYTKFLELAWMVRGRGFTKWSARAIMQRLRWFSSFETSDPNWGSDFKINNNYTPYYARKAMREYPEDFDIEGAEFFELRELKAL